MMNTTEEAEGEEKTHITTVDKEKNRNKNKIQGTKEKQVKSITRRPTTETSNGTESETVDE